jgi:hypothetical protein
MFSHNKIRVRLISGTQCYPAMVSVITDLHNRLLILAISKAPRVRPLLLAIQMIPHIQNGNSNLSCTTLETNGDTRRFVIVSRLLSAAECVYEDLFTEVCGL